jgi:hypothetical protein
MGQFAEIGNIRDFGMILLISEPIPMLDRDYCECVFCEMMLLKTWRLDAALF